MLFRLFFFIILLISVPILPAYVVVLLGMFGIVMYKNAEVIVIGLLIDALTFDGGWWGLQFVYTCVFLTTYLFIMLVKERFVSDAPFRV